MQRVADLLDGALAAGTASAAAISIGDGGREVARIVRGYTSSVPARGTVIDQHTLFDVASLTKPMSTAAIAMVLANDGLDLAMPLRHDYTFADLLGHGAGCAAHVEFFRTMREAIADPRATLVERAAKEPLAAPPRTQALYSDLGYIILGAALEAASQTPLEEAFAKWIAGPLGLSARFALTPIAGAVATERDDERGGIVTGLVHDENAYYGGRVCGHAGLFASIDDVARFAMTMVHVANGARIGHFEPAVVTHFLTTAAVPGASWRLGWDTPSSTPGVSHAGDRWPREHAVGHLGFTGTSLWLDLPRRRWVALLTNRVHPTRHATAEAIKALRRACNDAVVEALG